ncbi:LOW QUALITY PROTEIN: tigger transposable element-derived protein 6-like protein [Plakobranchus ocellatus]|uniref:Tigger transposable element-derived protein 6-like protein n=1 Tax=Plakobranchus ocellatus TaxID=259542 RepID=A0AAV4B896_9GAST|nr:LOW QUALITY PROTEIN: tigger transposable element-derived protein 6-like protein [Plakobranchus ocellatus]
MAKNQHHPKWTKDQLALAIEEVKNGAAKRRTAEKYGIPWGTFSDKLSGRRQLQDKPKTVLSEEEEAEIVNFLKEMSVRGFGKTKNELLMVVKNYLDHKGRKTLWEQNMPSDKWFRLFRKRHTEIVFRKPQLLGKQRALVSKKDILDWFFNFSQVVKDIDASILLEPERICNCDESGFSLNALSGRVLSYLENKFVYQVGSEAKTLITALICCSATGHYTWPMLIYPGTQFRGIKPQEVFEQSFKGRSENGWINQNLFFEWLKLVFVPQTTHIKKPLLLLVDGHVSHQSLQTSSLCDENQIILYCLPPHSSHILQPLDVGVFKTMKAEWKLAVKRQNETEIVTKRTFAKTFKDAYERTVARPLCEKAFKSCGIYPFDPNSIEWSKVLPSNDEYSAPPPAQTQHPVTSTPVSTPPAACSTPTAMGSPAVSSTLSTTSCLLYTFSNSTTSCLLYTYSNSPTSCLLYTYSNSTISCLLYTYSNSNTSCLLYIFSNSTNSCLLYKKYSNYHSTPCCSGSLSEGKWFCYIHH